MMMMRSKVWKHEQVATNERMEWTNETIQIESRVKFFWNEQKKYKKP